MTPIAYFCPAKGCGWTGITPTVGGIGLTHWYTCPTCGHWLKVQPC